MKPGKMTRKTKKSQISNANGISRPVPKIPLKRFLMQRRRIDCLLSEIGSLKNKNKDVLETLQSEKMTSASLRKDLYHLQRQYHESLHTVNTYKVQQVEMSKTLSTIMREMNKMYPNILGVTDFVSGTKVKITKMLSTLPSDYDFVSNQYLDNRNYNESFTRKSDKPMKQTVGPMVRGMLIRTKPKIMLERIMLPVTQDQDQTINDMPAEENNELTPIQEINEQEVDSGLELGHVTVRQRRRMGWRVRSKGKMSNNRDNANEKKVPCLPAYNDDSSDTESNTGRQMEPNVPYNDDSSDSESNSAGRIEQAMLFNNVSHLLQSSPIVKVPKVGMRENNITKSNLEQCRLPKSTRNEHPLEGQPGCSSWMYPAYTQNSPNPNPQNQYRSCNKKQRSSSDDSLYKPEDIDRNDGMVVTQNRTSVESPIDTLVNCTYNISENSRNSSNLIEDNALASSPIEPDSTNNIEPKRSSLCGRKRSSNHQSSSSSFVSENESSRTSTNLIQCKQNISTNTNNVSVRLEKTPDSFRLLSSPVAVTSTLNTRQSHSQDKRQSSCLNKRQPSVDNGNAKSSPLIMSGKRVRKPKCYAYPGEESPQPPKIKRNKQAKVPVKKTSISEKQKSKRKTILGLRPSRGSQEFRTSTDPEPKGTINNATKKKNSVPNKPPKKSSKKLSLYTPNTSINEGAHQVSGTDSSRPQRNKQLISYKESPLNVKQRRP